MNIPLYLDFSQVSQVSIKEFFGGLQISGIIADYIVNDFL